MCIMLSISCIMVREPDARMLGIDADLPCLWQDSIGCVHGKAGRNTATARLRGLEGHVCAIQLFQRSLTIDTVQRWLGRKTFRSPRSKVAAARHSEDRNTAGWGASAKWQYPRSIPRRSKTRAFQDLVWRLRAGYGKTRDGVSRNRHTQVDATLRTLRPSTRLIRLQYPWFCSKLSTPLSILVSFWRVLPVCTSL